VADLRESGDLENTADSMLGLYLKEMGHLGEARSNKKLVELSLLQKQQLEEEVGTMRRLVWGGQKLHRLCVCAASTLRAGDDRVAMARSSVRVMARTRTKETVLVLDEELGATGRGCGAPGRRQS
jgi:hypothetical protein